MARHLIPSAYVTFDKDAGTVTFRGNYDKQDILLITDVTAGKTLYQFNSPNFKGTRTFDETSEKTTVNLAYDTANDAEIFAGDRIQVFVSVQEERITFAEDLLDGVGKIRVSTPGNLIDTDFEYGLQSTKWETLQSVNNIPTVYSSSGDKPLDGITSVDSVAGSKQVKVTCNVPHNIELGNPVSVQGLDDYQAEGFFTISGVDGEFVFFFELDVPATTTGNISGGYTTIVPAKFFEGSPLPVSVIDGAQTDSGSPSKIAVTTDETHGFAVGTKVYLRNTIGPKSLIISDAQAIAPDGRPYIDTDAVFTTNISVVSAEDTGRTGVRQSKVVPWDYQSTYTLYISPTTVDTGTNTITWPSHDLPSRSTVLFNTPTIGDTDAGLVDGVVYYVGVIDTNTIKLYSNYAMTTEVTLSVPANAKGACRIGLCYKIREAYPTYDLLYTEYSIATRYRNDVYAVTDEYRHGSVTAITANRFKVTTYDQRVNGDGENQGIIEVANAFGGWTGYLDGLVADGARLFFDRIGEGGGDFDAADEWSTVTFYDPSGNATITFGTGPTNPEGTYIDTEVPGELNHSFNITDAVGGTTANTGALGQWRYDLDESSTLIAANSYFHVLIRLELTDAQRATFKETYYAESGADLALVSGGWGLGRVRPNRVLAFANRVPGVILDAGQTDETIRDLYVSSATNANSRYGVVKPVNSNVIRETASVTGKTYSGDVFGDGAFRINYDMGTDLDRFIRYGATSEVYYMFVADLNSDKNTIYEVAHGITSSQTATVTIDQTAYDAGQRFKFANTSGGSVTIAEQSFAVTLSVVSPDLFRITLGIAPNTDDILDFPDAFSVVYNTENDLYNTFYVNNHKIVSQSPATYFASGLNEPATVDYNTVLNQATGVFTSNGRNIGENEENASVRMYQSQTYKITITGLDGLLFGDKPKLWFKGNGLYGYTDGEWATHQVNPDPLFFNQTIVDVDSDTRTIEWTAGTPDLPVPLDGNIAISINAPANDYATGGVDENYIFFTETVVSDVVGGITNATAYNLNRVNDSRLTLTQVVDTAASATTATVGRASNATITEFVNFETPLGITPTGASITAVQYRGDFNESQEYVEMSFTDGTNYFIGRSGGADTQTFRNDITWAAKDVSALLVDNGGNLGVNVTFNPTSRINARVGSMTNWWEIRFVVTGATGTVILDTTSDPVGEQEFLVDSLRGAYDGVFAMIEEVPANNEFILQTDFKIPAREYEFTAADVSALTGLITLGFEHNLITGEKVTYDAGLGNTAMLTDETSGVFYVISVSSTSFKLAVSADSALNNIETGLTPQTGTHTFKARSLIKSIAGQGLITFASGGTTVTGSGSKFLTTFKRFDRIYVKGANYVYSMTVRDIQTDEKMRVYETFTETVSTPAEYFFITQVMLRPDGYSLHKSFDGGVDITAGTSPDSRIVRQSRKYFRYQSGKGIQNSLAINFNPSRVMRELVKSSGTTAQVVTQEQHNLKVGDSVKIAGAEVGALSNNPYNGTFSVTSVLDAFTFTYEMAVVPDEAKASGFPSYVRSGWTDSFIRAGMFDDQNGFFYEYDGQQLYAVVRSSTLQLAGSVTASRNSQVITGKNTSFTTQVEVGGRVVIRGQSYKVVEVTSDLRMVVQPAYRGITATGIKATKTENRKVAQEDWNIDACDGKGPSGYNLDLTKIQMAYADYSWYGAGKVRFGFKDREGHIKYVHQFIHNNRLSESYFRSGNLPGRYEIENGPAPSTAPTLFHFGTSVIMDGRFDDDKAYLFSRNSKPFAFTNGASRTFASNAVSSFDVITLNANRVFVYAIPCTEALASATVVGSQITVSGGSQLPEGTYVTQVKLAGAASKVFTSYPATNSEPALATIASGATLINGEVTAIDLDAPLPLVSLRLAPSVDSSLTGAVGEREIINRMQLRLRQAGITTSQDVEIFLILNATPSKADFQGAESPSLSQIINHDHGDTLVGGTTIYSVKGSAGSVDIALDELLELGNSILGGDGIFPNGPDLLTLAVQPQSTSLISGTNPFFVSGKISWSESQA